MTRTVILSVLFATLVAQYGFPAPGLDCPVTLETIRGTVRSIKVGGVETSSRVALAIGDHRFEVAGSPMLVSDLFDLAGHEVEVRGLVTHLLYLGGEGYALLTPLSVVRICKCLPSAVDTPSILKARAAARVLEAVKRKPISTRSGCLGWSV
jgi:hypothetical protein